MSKILAILAVFGLSLCAFDEVNLELLEVQGEYAMVANSDKLALGSSGVVVHKFSKDSQMIISRAHVIEKNGANARLKFEPFVDLRQKALPSIELNPQKGDIVLLNHLYDRALIVAPNRALYDEMVAKFTNISFIHPDIFAAYLDRNFQPNPGKEDFRVVCEKNAAGLVLFVLNGESVFVDCQNFTEISHFASANATNFDLPFYSRVKNIETSFWNFGSKYIKNYDEYYRNLIKFR